MSFAGRIIAGARDLLFGGPLGAPLDRTAHHIPTWHAHDDGESRDGDPRRRAAFTIAVIALGAMQEAYDRLVRASHLDLPIAQGLPPECIALATARVARINSAYARLAKGEMPPPA
ncbi:MAG: hypothetical protein JO282_13915 [Alphaproteobacteria bacterium]|nr:hypothetical protein [Alphaproteobacteria bacterium]